MKKVLILNGSPKGSKGNTAKLVDTFIEGLNYKKEYNIKNVELKNKEINNCTGCFSCWQQTPGDCVFNDDMDYLLDKYIESDLIIWATPLYNFGMTSLMKKFIERTLPLNKPEIIKKNGTYTHPLRYENKNKENILISTCGFPKHSNFNLLIDQFQNNIKGKLNNKILTVMGELLTKEPLQNNIAWYLDAVRKAGKEYAREGMFKEKTKKTLNKKLVPVKDYIEMANASWAQAKDNKNVDKSNKGYNFLKMMKHAFNAESAEGIEAILEFEFTDIEEYHHFIISNKECNLQRGKSDNYTTKIITTYKVWKKISEGQLDGEEAMLEGLYKVKGDMALVKKLDKLFGSGEKRESKKEAQEARDSKFLGQKALKYSFIPWIISWIFIEMYWSIGLLLPLGLSLALIFVKKHKSLEITHFEKANLLYFAVLNIVGIYNYELLKEVGIEFNYFAIAVIWGTTILFKNSLTSDYSKYNYSNEISQTKLFNKINNIITSVWTSIFIIMGISIIILKNINAMKFSPLLYILIILGLIFTNYFPEKYQEYIFNN